MLEAFWTAVVLIFLGTMAALAIGLNVSVGRLLMKRLPRKAVFAVAGALFIVFGLLHLRILLLPSS
jgi:putative Ca2+/H+ antiporter (TMEM165/GDT1 family)